MPLEIQIANDTQDNDSDGEQGEGRSPASCVFSSCRSRPSCARRVCHSVAPCFSLGLLVLILSSGFDGFIRVERRFIVEWLVGVERDAPW